MGEECIDGSLAVVVELPHLLSGVALGHDGQVDARSDVDAVAAALSTPYIIIRYGVGPERPNEDVARVDGVSELSHDLVVDVAERDADVDLLSRHG